MVFDEEARAPGPAVPERDGGYKAVRHAPYSRVDENELGAEWQFNPQMELTCSWAYTDRTNTTAFSTANTLSYGQFIGQLLRGQFQVNYWTALFGATCASQITSPLKVNSGLFPWSPPRP